MKFFIALVLASSLPDPIIKNVLITFAIIEAIMIWGIIELKPIGYYLSLLLFALIFFNSLTIIVTSSGVDFFNRFEGSQFIRGPFQFLFSLYNLYYFYNRKHIFFD